ncbi:hypothetical protein NDA13_002286 [Ustilago tritici]|nr:hypothetical protein NDA13_002286 [Ustilago tritici]
MPDPNLQSYIASHYLSGPKADAILARSSDGKLKRKKKKPKIEPTDASSIGIVIKDDADSWKVTFGEDEDEDEDGLTRQIVNQADGGPSKAFRKISSSSKIIPDDADVKEELSTVVEEQTAFKAGLRSKEEMKAARLAREERRKREAEASASTSTSQAAVGQGGDGEDEEARLAQETIYRDSSGRIIDIKAQEAHEKALERERQLKETERKTWSQGLVQKQQKRQAEEQLASVREKSISRKATDEEYNRHFKEQERADDPALAFMTKKREKEPQKPKYKGPWPLNRFNIPPGYRWDGVDRGNGFEKALIERKGVLENREREARAWGQADM